MTIQLSAPLDKLLALRDRGWAKLRYDVFKYETGRRDEVESLHLAIRESLTRGGLTRAEADDLFKAGFSIISNKQGAEDGWLTRDDVLWAIVLVSEEKIRVSSRHH